MDTNKIEILKIKDEFIKDRTIMFSGRFNEANCDSLKEQLLYLGNQDAKKDITIYISSFGGSVCEFLKIYGILEAAKHRGCRIITVAVGYAMSAGAYLLLLGDERYAYPNTRIMLHELAWQGGYAKLHDKTADYKESKILQKKLCELVKNRTKIKKVEDFLKTDQYMGVEEALKAGVIHSRV